MGTTICTANFEIRLDLDTGRGYFEHEDLGDECGGGLWFNKVGDRLELVDYDGVFALPREVYEALRARPELVVDEDFDPDL